MLYLNNELPSLGARAGAGAGAGGALARARARARARALTSTIQKITRYHAQRPFSVLTVVEGATIPPLASPLFTKEPAL